MIVLEAVPLATTATCTHGRARPLVSMEETPQGNFHVALEIVCEQCGKHLTFLTPGGAKQVAKVPATWDENVAGVPKPETNGKAAKSKQDIIDQIRRKGGEGPGTELAVLTWQKGIVASCQACDDLAHRMNEWGDECRGRIEEIVDDILPRAQKWISENRPAAIRTFVEESQLPRRVKDWLGGKSEAIDKATLKAGSLVDVESRVIRRKLRGMVGEALDNWESRRATLNGE